MLSIIIPCFNEERIILESIKSVQNWVLENNCKAEILIVNNKSTDNTVKQITKLNNQEQVFLLNEELKGKGAAVKKGLQNCNFNKVLILDADLSTDISEFNLNWLREDTETLFIGSRSLGDEFRTPLRRVLTGKVFNFIVRKFLNLEFMDTQCGFKYINSKKIHKISELLTFTGFSYDVDLILACKKLEINIEEVPIKYFFNSHSSVSIIKDSVIMFWDIVKIKKKYKNFHLPK
jgi:dolichyl-phosphate beta-glucosyltransferase